MLRPHLAEYSGQVRLSAWLIIAVTLAFTARSMLLIHPPWSIHVIRGVLVAVAALVLWLLPRQHTQNGLDRCAFTLVAALCAAMVVQGFVAGTTFNVFVAGLLLPMYTASMAPWDWKRQALTCLFVAVSITTNQYLIRSPLDDQRSASIVFALSVFSVSCVITVRRSRDRRQLEELLATRDANEAALRTSEQQMRLFFENTPDIVYRLGPDNAFEAVSPSVRRYGYEPEDLIGLPPAALANDSSRWVEILAERDRRGGFDDYDIELRMRDGSLFTVSITSRPIRDQHGTIIGWHGIGRDVSERRRLTNELLESRQQAEAASRAKSDFVAHISHELRTPLAGTLGMLEILLDTPLPAAVRGWAEAAKISADTLAGIINNVVDLAKIEAGAVHLESIEFALLETLKPTVKTNAIRAQQKGVDFFYKPAADLPRRIVGDPTRLRQVVSNLLGNAVKFTTSGCITLSVRAERRENDRWLLLFDVADTGPGIAPDQQQAIFRPFVQADTSITRLHGGSGLGLSICIELAAHMNGAISLDSEPGKGSVFHFSAEVGASNADAPESAAELRGLSLLLVSPSRAIRDAITPFLLGWGVHVDEAADATALLEAFDAAARRNTSYDLILLDAQVGRGRELVAAQAHAGLTTRPRVIPILKAAYVLRDWGDWEGLDVDSYLESPTDPDDLRQSLRKVVKRATATAPEATPPPRQLRVLLAEDSETVRTVVAAQLNKRHCDVTVVSDGKQAVEACKRRAFDLILMDIQMPLMDGMQAAQAIRTRQTEGARPPLIVAMTGRVAEPEEQSYRAAGIDVHLVKPVRGSDLDVLLDRLRNDR